MAKGTGILSRCGFHASKTLPFATARRRCHLLSHDRTVMEGLLRCEQEAETLEEAVYTLASQGEVSLEEEVRNASRRWPGGPAKERGPPAVGLLVGGGFCFAAHHPTHLLAPAHNG